jgi:hypothetical protein
MTGTGGICVALIDCRPTRLTCLHLIDKPMLTINFADENPPQVLNMPTASNYTSVLISAGPDSYGHMNIAHPAVWASAVQSFLQRLPPPVADNIELRR